MLVDPTEGKLIASDVIDYIARTGKVDAKVEGRIVKS